MKIDPGLTVERSGFRSREQCAEILRRGKAQIEAKNKRGLPKAVKIRLASLAAAERKIAERKLRERPVSGRC